MKRSEAMKNKTTGSLNQMVSHILDRFLPLKSRVNTFGQGNRGANLLSLSRPARDIHAVQLFSSTSLQILCFWLVCRVRWLTTLLDLADHFWSSFSESTGLSQHSIGTGRISSKALISPIISTWLPVDKFRFFTDHSQIILSDEWLVSHWPAASNFGEPKRIWKKGQRRSEIKSVTDRWLKKTWHCGRPRHCDCRL
jgi:hypothetical protein